MNIVLTGFMASGKTTIAREIEKISDYSFIDTDELIVEKTKMSINDIFERFGEDEFRKIEHNVICDASKLDNMIISTGGGVPLNSDNIEKLRENGIIVNLSPSFDVIKKRISSAKATRPLLKDNDLKETEDRFNYRLPFYRNCDISINIVDGYSPEYYASEILEKVNSFKSE